MFSQSDVHTINLGSLSQFYRRREVWLLYFYKSSQAESRLYKDVVRQIATKYYGIFKVGAVDCVEEEELCEEEFQAYETPKFYAFPANIRSEPVRYDGSIEFKKLVNFAVNQMENFVNLVRKENYDEFINQDKDQYKVLLFTQKKSTPPLYRALSKELLNKLVFGEVRESEKELISIFRVTTFPTLMVVTNPSQYEGVVYAGNITLKDQLMKFLRQYAYEDIKKRIQGNENKLKVMEITESGADKQGFCGATDNNMCFLVVAADNQQFEDYKVRLNELAQFFKDDPVKFYYILRSNIVLENIFDEADLQSFPFIALIKGRKKKYFPYTGAPSNLQSLKDFLDNIISGSGTSKKLIDTLEKNVFPQARTDL